MCLDIHQPAGTRIGFAIFDKNPASFSNLSKDKADHIVKIKVVRRLPFLIYKVRKIPITLRFLRFFFSCLAISSIRGFGSCIAFFIFIKFMFSDFPVEGFQSGFFFRCFRKIFLFNKSVFDFFNLLGNFFLYKNIGHFLLCGKL